MRIPVKYYFIILLLLLPFSYGTNDNSNIHTTNSYITRSGFNLNDLYQQNHYSVLADENIIYFPEMVKAECPNIADKIISNVPPEQNPNLKPSDCDPNASGDIHAQMFGSCDPDLHGNFGNLIKSSVVRLSIPISERQVASCSGTVIGQKWILSAAHCFTDRDNNFYSVLINTPIMINNQYTVKSIYIPQNYNISANIKNDIAVLELAEALPANYKPIKLETQLPPNNLDVPVWSAGYGSNLELRYRKQYFISNLFVADWDIKLHHKAGNFNELYISGTKPTINQDSNEYIAWQFIEKGDSGGPALLYNPGSNTLTLLGVLSYAMTNCNYAFLGLVPYNYAAYMSVPAYHSFIQDVMNKTIPPSAVQILTLIPNTKFSMLIMSSTNNNIAYYHMDETKEQQNSGFITTTGTYPTAIAKSKNFAYVTNYSSNNISRCSTYYNFDCTTKIPLPSTSNPTDIKIIDNYAFVSAYQTNKLLIYRVNYNNGNLDSLTSVDTGLSPASIAITSIDKLNYYIFVANQKSNSISVYKFNPSTPKLDTIDKNMRLDGFSGVPLKILANGPYLLVQGTHGISLYMFYGDEIEPKAFQPIAVDPKANSDMILLPGVKLPFGLLAVSNGDLSTTPVEIYDIDFTNYSIKFNTFLPVRGTGLAAYLNSQNYINLYVVNATSYKQRTISLFDIYPQKNIGEKISFNHFGDFPTIENPNKIEIQPDY